MIFTAATVFAQMGSGRDGHMTGTEHGWGMGYGWGIGYGWILGLIILIIVVLGAAYLIKKK